MGIGTSKGAYYETEFDHGIHTFGSGLDDNVVDPMKMQKDVLIGNDPKNIYDDQGSIIDYDTKLPTMKEFEDKIKGNTTLEEEPLLHQQSMKNQMPFPDNKDPRSDFDNRYPKELPPSGILNDLKPQNPDRPLIRRIANITNTPDEIISGLEGVRTWQNRGTAGPTQIRRGANDNKEGIHDSAGNLMSSFDVDRVWSHFSRGQDIINQRGALMDKMRDSGLNDLEKQKLKNLDKQHEEHFRGNYPD